MSKKTDDSKRAAGRPLRVLVTGASGFVGSAIAEHCYDVGMNVLSTGNSNQRSVNMPGYFRADLTLPESLDGALTDVDAVVHAAGLAHQIRDSIKSPPFTKVNVKGTENVARAAFRAGVRHFVLISSVSVYGVKDAGVIDEDSSCDPQEPYAKSKYQAEQRAIEILEGSDIRVTILRLTTVYGEGDPGNVARLMRTIDRARFVWVGDGSNRKSLIYRDDVARACVHVLRQPSQGTNIYNVVGSVNTMREIVEGLASALDRDLLRWRIPTRVAKTMAVSFDRIARGRQRSRKFSRTVEKWLDNDVYDGTKFDRRFDFSAKVSLLEGLQREVAWYRQRLER